MSHAVRMNLFDSPALATYDDMGNLVQANIENRFGQIIGIVLPQGNGKVMCASAASGWDEIDADDVESAVARITSVARLIGLDRAETEDEAEALRRHYAEQRADLWATYVAAREHLQNIYSVRVA
ncbi:hypothetical protein AB0J38_14545 [Streptomyces sp. NPDC050095]|uniref:hypothetical protein n=1 Tax=unclassified Streptomyces TaxID=2593676 RepID=UPI00341432D2